MRIPVIFLASVLALATLSGCKSKETSCKEFPLLKVFSNLDPPNMRNALRVPPLDTPERIRGKDEPCLDIPPPFANPKGPDAAKPK